MKMIFKFHNGDEIKVNIEGFNSTEFEEKLNNPQIQFIAIGNGGFQKNNLSFWDEDTKVV